MLQPIDATTVPRPSSLGSYASTCTTTISAVIGMIEDLDLSTRLATSTAIHSGTLAGTWSKPGDAVQPLPSAVAKPLKLAGATPPLSLFAVHHDGLQKVTAPVADPSPTTNIPPAGTAYTTTPRVALLAE